MRAGRISRPGGPVPLRPADWEGASRSSPLHPNHDRWLADGQRFAVADGCGGGARPAWAASEAIRAVAGCPGGHLGDVGAVWKLFELIDAGIQRASPRLGRAGTTTTLTTVFVSRDELVVSSIGDSRCWVGRAADDLCPVTSDDTDAAALGLTFGDSRYGQCSRFLTASLGNGDVGSARPIRVDLDGPTLVVLTTDGVHDHLSADGVRAVLAEGYRGAADRLVRAARRSGSTDDATAIVIRFGASPGRPPVGTAWTPARREVLT